MEIQGLLQNPRFTRVVAVIAALTGIYLILSIFVIGGEGFYNALSTLIPPVAGLATGFLFFTARQNKRDAAAQSFWLGLAVGFTLWGLADGIWAYYTLILKEESPYPSLADLVWLIGYVPLYYALISRLRTLKIVPTRRQTLLSLAINLI
jgi:hypothetical protein